MYNQEIVKKKIMFSTGNDLYFLTYNILIFLKTITNGFNDVVFKDHRKLAILIEFVSNPFLIEIIEQSYNNSFKMSSIDRAILIKSYYNGFSKIPDIYRLLLMLSNKGLVYLNKDVSKNVLDVKINYKSIPRDFFDKKYYSTEIENAKKLKNLVQRVSIKNYDSVLQDLFGQFNIKLGHT